MHNCVPDGYAILKKMLRKGVDAVKRFIIILLLLYSQMMGTSYAEMVYMEHHAGVYYTIVDSQTGVILLHTGIKVEVGDEWITENNQLFRVNSINGFTAYANYLRDETVSMHWEGQVVPTINGPPAQKLVAVYHSHTDEAYTPTDGKSSIRGNGSIMKVGDTFTETLRSLGYTVEHDKTLHDPHDANAYIRSRRTVARLLGAQPIALFDVHRNSAPVAEYKLTSGGEQVARMVLVVGQANPYLPTTREFAKQLKAASDAKYPKLVRGIFLARGDYNQDVHPRAILIEIGTEGSTLEEAQKGAAQFANSIPAVLGVSQTPPPGAGPTAPSGDGAPDSGTGAPTSGDRVWNFGSGTFRNILWLVGLTIAGGITYLYISAGSWHAARQKLAQFRNLEFANLLGIRSKKKK